MVPMMGQENPRMEQRMSLRLGETRPYRWTGNRERPPMTKIKTKTKTRQLLRQKMELMLQHKVEMFKQHTSRLFLNQEFRTYETVHE